MKLLYFVFTFLFIVGCSKTVQPEKLPSSNIPTAPQEDASIPLEETQNYVTTEEKKDINQIILTSIYFKFDKYNIEGDQKNALFSNIKEIKDNGLNIKLEGNTDEFGSDEYNYALGLKRAISVRDAMLLQGISKNNVSIISYGKSKPICSEQTQACYAKNRRVDFKILGQVSDK